MAFPQVRSENGGKLCKVQVGAGGDSKFVRFVRSDVQLRVAENNKGPSVSSPLAQKQWDFVR